MYDILSKLQDWLAQGESIALATVVYAEGSSPRPVGSRMAVTASGKMAGSVSGGCVEGAIFQEAESVLAGGQAKRLRYGVVDETGWEVGLACGGTIEVYLEVLTSIHEQLLVALANGETVTLVTPLDGGEHLLTVRDGSMVGDTDLSSVPSWNEGDWTAPMAERRGDHFVQCFAPPPTLTIVGAVHLAQQLSQMAQLVGFRVRVVDARRVFATRERFPDVDELVIAWPKDGLVPSYLRSQDAVVILTHDPKFDIPALEIALNSPVGYIGLLGSRTTQAKRQRALLERGVPDGALSQIHGPVGLDLGGQRPEEIAVEIIAQIIAVQNERQAAISGMTEFEH
jgi:xanthine dehydrogenase accessory factor